MSEEPSSVQPSEDLPEPDIQTQPDERDLQALEMIRKVCHAGDFHVEPKIRCIEGSYLQVELVGEDAGHVFGRNGRMLDALQYVINLMIAHQLGPGLRVLLDADGYREKRKQLLESLARKYAALVKEKQLECEFDPLPPHERRIIHRLFKDDPDVTSYSEGEEPQRKVILVPRNPRNE
jgi:spoIIIJ-associated protein